MIDDIHESVKDNPQTVDWESELKECRTEIATHSDRTQYGTRYLDQCGHGESAERAYRQGFKKSAIESLLALLSKSGEGDLSDEVHGLEMSVASERAKVRKASTFRSKHHLYYFVGHEIDAARTRGAMHGLVSAIQLIESSNTDDEATCFHRHVANFSAWVMSVCKWADGNCSVVEAHRFSWES